MEIEFLIWFSVLCNIYIFSFIWFFSELFNWTTSQIFLKQVFRRICKFFSLIFKWLKPFKMFSLHTGLCPFVLLTGSLAHCTFYSVNSFYYSQVKGNFSSVFVEKKRLCCFFFFFELEHLDFISPFVLCLSTFPKVIKLSRW